MKKLIVCICYRSDSYILTPTIFDGDMDIEKIMDKIKEEMLEERGYYNIDDLIEDYAFSTFVIEI